MTVPSSPVFILLLTLFVALPQFNNASFLSDACVKAATFDENFNRDFCVTSLQANPRIASANINGLARMSVNLAIKNVTNTISRISYLLSKPAYAHLKSDLSFCQEQYSEAKQALFDAVRKIISNNNYDATWALTGAMTAMDTCEDESSDKSVLSKDHAIPFQLCAMALTFLNKEVFK
jgi:pectinesterase inhibitor-like protein